MSLLLKHQTETERQAGFIALKELRKPWVDRFMLFDGRTIPVAATVLTPSDAWGGIKVRWGVGRMDYSVLPGLYAVGNPCAAAAVFATANYKLSFDALRSNLAGLDAWVLVLDTKGINVWCAAGKGTFGTDELVSRIAKVRLSSIISHCNLILPQLGAPGVSSHQVAKRSGFQVTWGPVRAEDIPAWLAAGMKKDEAMRLVTFNLRERMAVAPVEIAHSWPVILAAIALGALYGLPFGSDWLRRAFPAILILAGTVPVGTILFPALLPWLPGRVFVIKGALLGTIWAGLCALACQVPILAALGGVLVAAPVVGYLGLNFTGASTFTCQPGTLLEVEKSFWPLVISTVVGVGLTVASRILGS